MLKDASSASDKCPGWAYCKIPDTGIESTFTGQYVAPTGLEMHALARYCKEECIM
jgi:hypothetical protein